MKMEQKEIEIAKDYLNCLFDVSNQNFFKEDIEQYIVENNIEIDCQTIINCIYKIIK